MSLKKSLILVLILFIVSNVLTTLWYMSTDTANFVNFRRAEINYGGLVLNHLLFALGFTYLFPFYTLVFNSKWRAFLFGVLLAGIMFIPTGIVVRSIWQVDFNVIFLFNSMAHMTIGGIMGLVASVIYNYKKK